MFIQSSRHNVRLGVRWSLLFAAAFIFFAQGAQAAGFYIQEQSVSGLGSAFSGSTTSLNDPSTIFYNPAGMTKLPGTQVQGGVSVLIPYAHLTNTGSTLAGGTISTSGNGGNPYEPTPVPDGYISHQFTDSIWGGISVTAPFGLANNYDKGWFGRYDSTKTVLQVIDIQPTLAYKFNDMFSIGAGVNIQHAHAILDSAVTNGVTEGENQLTGSDWHTGYSLGVQFKPQPATTIGMNYHSGITHRLVGQFVTTGAVGLNANVGAHADLNLPNQASLGIAHKLNDRWTVQGQATWFGWNRFQTIAPVRNDGVAVPQTYQGYQNTWTFAAGAEYVANDKWTLRGGVQFDNTPTTDQFRTSRTPDGDRTWLSTGATYALQPNLDLDMAATYIHLANGTINVTRNGGLAVVHADTAGSVGILALGAKYRF